MCPEVKRTELTPCPGSGAPISADKGVVSMEHETSLMDISKEVLTPILSPLHRFFWTALRTE